MGQPRIIVCSYRQPPCSLLLRWLKGLEWEVGSQEYGIDVSRNQNATRFLSESAGESLVMIDGDMIPDGRAIFDEPGELLWQGYVGHQGTAGHVDQFGCGVCRISRKMLKAVPQPWFATRYNAEMTRRLSCECSTFAAKVIAAGFEPTRCGIAGHQQGGDAGPVLYPDRVAWPYHFPPKIAAP